MLAHTVHDDLKSFIKYDFLHGRPLWLQLGLTDSKSDKVWVVWRETKESPLLTLYGKRGSDLRVGTSRPSRTTVRRILDKISEKLRKGYIFEKGYTLNQPSDFGKILAEVKETHRIGTGTILRDDQGRTVVEVPHSVGIKIDEMLKGHISKYS